MYISDMGGNLVLAAVGIVLLAGSLSYILSYLYCSSDFAASGRVYDRIKPAGAHYAMLAGAILTAIFFALFGEPIFGAQEQLFVAGVSVLFAAVGGFLGLVHGSEERS